MINQINRDSVDSIIESELSAGNKLIVTGMDSSGKSTLLSKYYGRFGLVHTNEEISQDWMEGDVSIDWFLEYFDIYDRHPVIDYPVYAHAYNEEFNMNEFVLDHLSMVNKYTYIVFINDKFFDIKPHTNEKVAKYRSEIKDSFISYCNLIGKYAKVLIVTD